MSNYCCEQRKYLCMPGWFEDFVDGQTGLTNRFIFMLTTERALATVHARLV